MSLFKDILAKLGLGHSDAPTTTTTTPASPSGTTTPTGAPPINPTGGVPPVTNTGAPGTGTPPLGTPPAGAPIDISAKLDGLAKQQGETLNWRTSIVDLLKVLGIDSSLEHRKELAVELGYPSDKLGDSAEVNQWLHKAVLQKISANGGTVPAELL
ncbi:DUF3597 domain-containing protein [Pseudomonas typographi]|uniref:DUF3597 domain-containing protein n=1 Tax=Pseudomonas typographi TaxID=2715964 RepID=A0ABR7Z7Y0_9PSED|nr:DUF3597 domain-containing protein [Pseudomonas typographi]MBD1553692.1 DUF3597 domain-containing protein [Pseudomonas typographi]MBD1589052.1 DUF3597 domain-containing protein [Pseudomonas typographi]MBD1601433.1 DUF3597 domain-containing protein [Pseudomonas typographi]